MHKIEPIELIENPLATVTEESNSSSPVSSPSQALLLQKRNNKGLNNSVVGRKRHSLDPAPLPTTEDFNCTPTVSLASSSGTKPLLSQSQSHHIIGREKGKKIVLNRSFVLKFRHGHGKIYCKEFSSFAV